MNTSAGKKTLFIIHCLAWGLAGTLEAAPPAKKVPKAASAPKAVLPEKAAPGAWPFDHRQILLVRDEKLPFPDDLTAAQFLDVFVKRGRVRWITLKGGEGQFLPIEVPRDFPWQSTNAVRQLGLKHQADGVVLLVQKGVQLDLRWYATLDGQPLFFETLSLPLASSPAEEVERKKRLQAWLNEIWDRIPGIGYVVSRDMGSLKIEGASQNQMKAGTELEIQRLVELQRHPLLKTLIGIRTQLTGKARLSQVADPLSTAKIEYESQADPIQAGDRYLLAGKNSAALVASGALSNTSEESKKAPEPVIDEQGREKIALFGDGKSEAAPAENKPPEENAGGIVDASAALGIGTATYQEEAGTVYKSKAIAPTIDVDARLYITRDWLLQGDFSMGFLNFKRTPAAYNSSISSTTNRVHLGAAYRYIFLDEGPQKGEFVVGIGYQRFSLAMSQVANAIVAPSSKNYSGFNLGFKVQIPVVENYAGLFEASRMFSTTLGESPASSGSEATNLVWMLGVGVKHRLNKEADISVGYRLLTASTNFNGQGSRVRSAANSLFRMNTFFVGYLHRF